MGVLDRPSRQASRKKRFFHFRIRPRPRKGAGRSGRLSKCVATALTRFFHPARTTNPAWTPFVLQRCRFDYRLNFGIARTMNSSNNGTVKATSPCARL
jgi:hypothetical protein